MSSGVPPGPDPRLTDDRMVTPERSVFGTRLPRPTGVGRHLLVVIAFSVIALGVAIVFAERDTSGTDDGKATSDAKASSPDDVEDTAPADKAANSEKAPKKVGKKKTDGKAK